MKLRLQIDTTELETLPPQDIMCVLKMLAATGKLLAHEAACFMSTNTTCDTGEFNKLANQYFGMSIAMTQLIEEFKFAYDEACCQMELQFPPEAH